MGLVNTAVFNHFQPAALSQSPNCILEWPFELHVHTGKVANAGTSARVYVQLFASSVEHDVRPSSALRLATAENGRRPPEPNQTTQRFGGHLQPSSSNVGKISLYLFTLNTQFWRLNLSTQ
ncbi:unnamed protein product [Protopolystoma xenopodis]|uniref:Uncharacterized protein n=1 Tax=Protopolystoma xenopodis TaxID=117903 RepID=A0A3S5C3X7_9PLAT|nr:unnamed protein product [Protopolystoma xenopodis]